MWGVANPKNGHSTVVQVILRLYDKNGLVAEENGNYTYKASAHATFEVLFPQSVSLRAGVQYNATSKIITRKNSNEVIYYQWDGRSTISCSGATIRFKPAARKSDGSYWSPSGGQIAGFVFKSPKC